MPSTADDVAAIRRLSGDWLAAFHAHDVPRMLTMITEDAVFMAPGMADVRGKPATERCIDASSRNSRASNSRSRSRRSW